MNVSQAFPIAVWAAIAIFLAREALEFWRRSGANARKLRALKRLVAAECEKNHFSVKRLAHQAEEGLAALKSGDRVAVVETRHGYQRFEITKAGEPAGSSPIPTIHSAMLDRYLFEAASVDLRLFEMMEAAAPCVAELQHIRTGMAAYPIENEHHLASFFEYALRELDDNLEGIRALYFYCTGEPLTATRLR